MSEEKSSIFLGIIYSYVATILMSILLSPIFGKLYIYVFKPIRTGGLSGYGSALAPFLLQSAIFAIPLLLPIFIFVFVSRKRIVFWLIGIIVPFTMFLSGGKKHMLWFAIFTIVGGLIGWLISLMIKKLKKS